MLASLSREGEDKYMEARRGKWQSQRITLAGHYFQVNGHVLKTRRSAQTSGAGRLAPTIHARDISWAVASDVRGYPVNMTDPSPEHQRDQSSTKRRAHSRINTNVKLGWVISTFLCALLVLRSRTNGSSGAYHTNHPTEVRSVQQSARAIMHAFCLPAPTEPHPHQ